MRDVELWEASCFGVMPAPTIVAPRAALRKVEGAEFGPIGTATTGNRVAGLIGIGPDCPRVRLSHCSTVLRPLSFETVGAKAAEAGGAISPYHPITLSRNLRSMPFDRVQSAE